MYRGRYAAAAEQLREAVLLNRAHRFGLSEFRDRLFLATVYETRGMVRPTMDEMAAAGRLAAEMTLAPDWLHMLGKAYARRGQIREAERLLERLAATAGDPTAVSGINRSTSTDEASMRLLRGEIALARGRADEALSDFEIAHRVRPHARTLEALATAHLSLNQNDEAASALADLIARRPLGAESQQEWLMAHLQLGRLHERRGEPDEARKLYESLIAAWKDADADLPAAREARQRLERLSKPVVPQTGPSGR